MKNVARYAVAILVFALVFSLAANAAAEGKKSPFVQAMLKMMGMSKKTVEKEVTAVGRGVKKGADVVVEEVKDVGKLAAGDDSKAKDILVKPVKGTTEMVGQTAHDVIKAPIEAHQETYSDDVK